MSRMRVACVLGQFVALLQISHSLLLGAFNIRTFGDTKASNVTLMNIISMIVHRYDIILIQERGGEEKEEEGKEERKEEERRGEEKEKEGEGKGEERRGEERRGEERRGERGEERRGEERRGTEHRNTHKKYDAQSLQRGRRGSPPFRYSFIVSEPLGRSSYKERYLFLYREDTVSVAKNYTYDDGCEPCGTDTFNREPFVVMFSSKHTAVENFVLIPQHTSPNSAVKEIDALYDVVVDVRHRWKTNDILLLGDFNAGCNYVTRSEWQQIRLFTDKSFHWLITDDEDTTVTHTICPYDRIVVTADMMGGVVPHSAAVYDYMVDLNLIHSLALAVSDHFPVEVNLIGRSFLSE
ncbi:Deoxyribonuclease-1 [Takifugu flavidus]|uniref:Deoxyribonuclease-1 n=1 Tax=Takifugu flavidus TaxID=433684 RepID=A0A5C6NQB4_9TELE|nr:Deoxyribonuclease-1 [Takifugu flavidus]